MTVRLLRRRRISTHTHVIVLTLLTGLFVPFTSMSLDADAGPQITVREEKGVYAVAARFSVSRSAATVVSVLTDYERIPKFMPELRTSRVLERRENQVLLEQEAHARLLLFSKDVHLLLEITEKPGLIRFKDRCGMNFRLYEGEWNISELSGQTVVRYDLRVTPAFDVPGFVLSRLLKRDATQMMDRLKAEITAR